MPRERSGFLTTVAHIYRSGTTSRRSCFRTSRSLKHWRRRLQSSIPAFLPVYHLFETRNSGTELCAQRNVILCRLVTAFISAGQSEMKTCAPFRVCGGPQTAAMRFDDGAADWESHTGTMRFRSKECAKYLFGLLRWQSNPRITDRHQ